jgi:acyl transferase domain-containing protein
MISTQSTEWKAAKCKVLINNYGAEGNKAAIVLQEPMPISPASYPKTHTQLTLCPIFISGKTTEAVRSYCDHLGAVLSRKDMTNTLADVAYNLALKQNREFETSLILTNASIEELSSQLKKTASGATELHEFPSHRPYVILCFGGQDGKWAYISKGLYHSSVLLQRHIVGDDQMHSPSF